MNIYEQLGMRLRFLRTQKHLSQEDVALEAGINKNYYSDLERGRRNPTLKCLDRIATSFNITLSELLKGIQSFE